MGPTNCALGLEHATYMYIMGNCICLFLMKFSVTDYFDFLYPCNETLSMWRAHPTPSNCVDDLSDLFVVFWTLSMKLSRITLHSIGATVKGLMLAPELCYAIASSTIRGYCNTFSVYVCNPLLTWLYPDFFISLKYAYVVGFLIIKKTLIRRPLAANAYSLFFILLSFYIIVILTWYARAHCLSIIAVRTGAF